MPYPDPEAVVVSHLKPRLPGVTVGTRLPSPVPARHVRVVHVGGTVRSVSHQDARITLECRAATTTDASALSAQVEGAIVALDSGGCHVPQGAPGWVGAPAYLEDPIDGTPRYVMTVTVRMRKAP